MVRSLTGTGVLAALALLLLPAAWAQDEPATAVPAGALLPHQREAYTPAPDTETANLLRVTPDPLPAQRPLFIGSARSMLEPRVAGFMEILDNVSSELTLFRYSGNQRVLILDLPGLQATGRAFNRLTVYVEGKGVSVDRVPDDDALHAYIGATGRSLETFLFGADFRASDVARFFTLARRDGVALNDAEETLLTILTAQNVIVANGAGFQATQPEQAVISVSQVQPDNPTTPGNELVSMLARRTIFRHELSHGEYFTNEAYRAHSWRFWREVLTEEDRDVWRRFLDRMHYDPRNEDLMVNEMQAYLMHTEDPRAFSARKLGVTDQRIAAWRAAFMVGVPQLPLFSEADPPLPAAATAR